jgi:hypothetical protein
MAVLLLAAVPGAWAQRAPMGPGEPHIGYVDPAGGQQGTEFQVTIGGQYLDGATRANVSGNGVEATVLKLKKPLNPRELNEIREILQKAREQLEKSTGPSENRAAAPVPLVPGGWQAVMKKAEELGVNRDKLDEFLEFQRARADPKRQQNAQLAETVTLRVKLSPDAEAGERSLRLMTSRGLTNPLRFHVGALPEHREREPNDKPADAIREPTPFVLNGQIMPGDVDRFSFQARRGQRLVIVAKARELMPYLADAVPGWFQATLALYDAEGHELAYDDDYRFHPDPVLYCVIPKSGPYVLEIKDAIYRGREDFVYRITVGELPFIKSIFPMGGQRGTRTTVELVGWNLPVHSLTMSLADDGPSIQPISAGGGRRLSNNVPFAVDTLPEQMEEEPNDESNSAQQMHPPLIVNGRIGKPGDIDVFRFRGRAGGNVVAEVLARRLGSPLDSTLLVTDSDGHRLATNDDFEDPSAGLLTHAADSRLAVKLPRDGDYFLHLADAQHQGGAEYGYRLRISASRPDFELRVVPSTVNAPAGASVPITVYAMRRDGFSDEIALALADPPPGYVLSGARVPAHQDKIRLTLTVPIAAQEEPVGLQLEGRAVAGQQELRRQAVPADDMMQAFIYHHLVPAPDWLVTTTSRGWRPTLQPVTRQPLRLPVGGTTRVELSAPGRLPVDRLRFSLDQTDGIAVESVSPTPRGVALRLRADAKLVKAESKGNLLINVFFDRTVQGKGANRGGQGQRVPLGVLPAIPFEIIASNPAASDFAAQPK